jgi:phosphinothricin acetyltransferase
MVLGETVYRAATPADVPAITEIYAEAVARGSASFEVVPPDATEMTARMRALHDAGYPYLVALIEGAVAGYGYAGPYRTRPGYRNTVENSIYLAAEARGKGIGGALLRRLVDECTARGFRQMVAVIGDSANIASIRLHKAAGFALVGTLKDVGYKHGRWLDSVLMQRALGPGANETPSR